MFWNIAEIVSIEILVKSGETCESEWCKCYYSDDNKFKTMKNLMMHKIGDMQYFMYMSMEMLRQMVINSLMKRKFILFFSSHRDRQAKTV